MSDMKCLTVKSQTSSERRPIYDESGNIYDYETVDVSIGTEFDLNHKPDQIQVKFLRFAAAGGTRVGLQRQIEILAQICPMKNDRNVRNIRITTLIKDLYDANASEFVVAMKAREYRQKKGNVFFPNHSDFYTDCVTTTKNFRDLYESIINPKPLLDKPLTPKEDKEPHREIPWEDKTDEQKSEVAAYFKKELSNPDTIPALKSMFRLMHKVPDDIDFDDY